MTEFNRSSRDEFYPATPVRQTDKAAGFSVLGSRRIAWFPKSQLVFIKDDFYLQPEDQFGIPLWLLRRKAAELGCLHWDIGSR